MYLPIEYTGTFRYVWIQIVVSEIEKKEVFNTYFSSKFNNKGRAVKSTLVMKRRHARYSSFTLNTQYLIVVAPLEVEEVEQVKKYPSRKTKFFVSA